MSKPDLTVALVCGPDCDMDSNAIRSAIEYFGGRVITYWIGRPNDLIGVLSGEELYPDTDYIILNFHGDEGQFVMPELDESVYGVNEPKGDFSPNDVKRFAKLKDKIILANGCTLGVPLLAQAFMDSGCQAYIGPDDYPDGNAALMFALRFFYEIIQNKKSVKEAFELAKTTDEEMSMYQFYERK